MTYCVVVAVNQGLVFTSDSRTNAGVDRVSTYSKMHRFNREGDRHFTILSAGNLGTTQAVISQVQRDIDEDAEINLMNVSRLEDAAEYLGTVNFNSLTKHKHSEGETQFSPEATFLLGGQIIGGPARAFLIYPEGNYITTSEDTPFLQIGESKYGKPILDRVVCADTALDECAKCSLVSMDSTMRSNLSVGMPIEILVCESDNFGSMRYMKFDSDSEYMRGIAKSWDHFIVEAFAKLPAIDWSAESA